MIGMEIKPLNKDSFFDSELVMKALGDAERKTLSKFGAFVRTRAKTSIRPAIILNRKARRAAKKAGQSEPKPQYQPSQPGEPPRSRTGILKRNIFFGYDADAHSVVIGPTLVGGAPSDVPHRLEFGGEFKTKQGRIVRVKKRPYMQPALDKEAAASMPLMFANSLFGG